MFVARQILVIGLLMVAPGSIIHLLAEFGLVSFPAVINTTLQVLSLIGGLLLIPSVVYIAWKSTT